MLRVSIGLRTIKIVDGLQLRRLQLESYSSQYNAKAIVNNRPSSSSLVFSVDRVKKSKLFIFYIPKFTYNIVI